MVFAERFFMALLLFLAVGCGEIANDLAPSERDRRPTVTPGTVGFSVGQAAPDFTLPDISGNPVSLAALLAADKPVVLYFSMWCPICDAEMSHLAEVVAPAHPNAAYLAVDYVSAGPSQAGAAAHAAGFGNSIFTVVSDADRKLLNLAGATMSTTILIDKAGIVRMNEDYRNGSNLASILASNGAREGSP